MTVSHAKTVVWDLGNVLIDWQADRAIAAGVGEEEAQRFLAADDFDFFEYNHGPDAGRSWDDAEAEVERTHPHWLPHCRAYRQHFAASLVGEVPGTADLVRQLAVSGVPQVGLTNWSAELFHHAPDDYEVVRLLDDVVVSGVEECAKPDDQIYRITEARASRTPDELVFIDDRPANTAAARALGWHAITFTDAETLRVELGALGLL